MMRVVAACVLVVSAAAYAASPMFRPAIRARTYIVDGGCTGLEVRPRLVFTASHCVPLVGMKLLLRRMDPTANQEDIQARVLADDPRRDMALVRIVDPTPSFQPLALEACPVQPRFQRLWTYGFSAGMAGWEAELEYVGRWNQPVERRWVTVYRGPVYPGASGSTVWNEDRQCLVGMITHGFISQDPPLVWGGDGYEIVSFIRQEAAKADGDPAAASTDQ